MLLLINTQKKTSVYVSYGDLLMFHLKKCKKDAAPHHKRDAVQGCGVYPAIFQNAIKTRYVRSYMTCLVHLCDTLCTCILRSVNNISTCILRAYIADGYRIQQLLSHQHVKLVVSATGTAD